MKVAWFTPLSTRSAVAEYSVEVCAALTTRCHVDLWVGDEHPWRVSAAPIVDARGRSLAALAEYDHVVFNLGDHPGFHRLVYESSRRHPGVCVLHDRTYDNLIGDRVDPEVGSSRTAIAGALGVIVHADDHAHEVEADWYGPVGRVPFPVYPRHLSTDWSPVPPHRPRTLLSFGYVNPNRQIHRVIEMFHREPLLREHLRYRVVGSAPDAGYAQALEEQVERYGLSECVQLAFGYQLGDEFDRHIRSADAYVNLREPPFESASASFLEQLAHGKPIVVSDVGYFSEVPAEAVLRIPPSDDAALRRALWQLATDDHIFETVGRPARAYAATRTVENTAESVIRYLEESKASRPLLRLTQRVATELAGFRASRDSEVVGQVASQIAPLAAR